jgi:hypothetical protein
MKFEHFSLNTTREDNIISTRLVLGPNAPMTVETELTEELSVVKHLDSIKDLIELATQDYLK